MAKKRVKKQTAKKAPKAKKSRSLNAAPAKREKGAPASEQDPKRRLGNFTTAGKHARQGGRTTGIVGQQKSKNKTDKRG